jgi:predicted ATPase
MQDARAIPSLTLQNLLSFGGPISVDLLPLNVVIGTNMSGKSNLLETLSFLHATTTDLADFLRKGGGITEWLWKGTGGDGKAEIQAVVNFPGGRMPLLHRLQLAAVGGRLEVPLEEVHDAAPTGKRTPKPIVHCLARQGKPVFQIIPQGAKSGQKNSRRRVEHTDTFTDPTQSVFRERMSAGFSPELNHVWRTYDGIRVYRDLGFGPHMPARRPQRTDDPHDFLLEDGSNLAMVLADVLNQRDMRAIVVAKLRLFYRDIVDVTVKIQGGVVQTYLQEKNLRHPVPAPRLSDGLLRYLCLLAILLHPNPPPLVGIEEPEIGMHPDVLPAIAEMLVEATARTQLFVTTHSEALVSAFSDRPEVVLVCERTARGTTLARLEKRPLASWLKNYSLGEVWAMGEIGGTL